MRDVTGKELADELVRRLSSDLRVRFPTAEVRVYREGELWMCEVFERGVSWGQVSIPIDAGDRDVVLSDEAEYAVARAYESVVDNLWPDELTDPWPLCPDHADHPLEPRIVKDSAAWVCTRGGRFTIALGALAAR